MSKLQVRLTYEPYANQLTYKRRQMRRLSTPRAAWGRDHQVTSGGVAGIRNLHQHNVRRDIQALRYVAGRTIVHDTGIPHSSDGAM